MSDLVEQTRQYLNETPDGLETEFLNEMISLRTGAIVMGLAKTKGGNYQVAKKIAQALEKKLMKFTFDSSELVDEKQLADYLL